MSVPELERLLMRYRDPARAGSRDVAALVPSKSIAITRQTLPHQILTRKHLTAAELATLIDAASGSRWALRDQTMIAFCLRHRLRAIELVALRWAHVDWRGQNVII